MSNSNEKYIGESLIREEPGKKLKLKIGDKVIKKKHLSDEVSEVFNDVDNLQNEIDSLEVAGIALSNDYGSNPLIGISQMKLTESYNEQTEKNAQYDEILDEHTTELENTYRKSETYSKGQIDEMITTPDQQYVTVAAFTELPALGSANTIYRVANWDGTQVVANCYTEYSWDGSQYIKLSTKNPGIDNVPTLGSNNLVKSGSVFNEDSYICSTRPKGKANNGNLIIYDAIISGFYYRHNDGVIIASDNWCCSPLIDVTPNTTYSKSANIVVVLFDENKDYIDYVEMNNTSFTTAATARYMGCNFTSAYKDSAHINEGATIIPYVAGEPLLEQSQVKELESDIGDINSSITAIGHTFVSTLCNETLLGAFYVINGTIEAYSGQICYYFKVIKGERLHITIETSEVTLRYGIFNSIPQEGSTTAVYGQQLTTGEFDYTVPSDGYFAFSFSTVTVSAHAVQSVGIMNSLDELEDGLSNKVDAVVGKNKFNKDDSSIVEGYYLSLTNGSPQPNASWEYLFLEGTPNATYTMSGFSRIFATWYESDGTYIEGVVVNTPRATSFTLPNNATKIGISILIEEAGTVQVELGSEATRYVAWQKGVGTESINNGAVTSDKLSNDIVYKKEVRVGANRQYTSLLRALKTEGENTRIIVDAGTYDIEAEYKEYYGNDFFSNYPMDGYHSQTDKFYAGLWLADKVELIANGLVTITFPYADGLRVTDVDPADRTRENFDPVAQYFSPLNTTTNVFVDGIDIKLALNNCRYHIHDDFAYVGGVNVFRNMELSGTCQKMTAFGCGMGIKNQYIIENCKISDNVISISYHNNSGSVAKNKLVVKDCFCTGVIQAVSLGTATDMTLVMVCGCRASNIKTFIASGYSVENMELVAWNNIIG